ncbi:MAG: hypothetical protein HY718_15120 [Planctomycetes bacterium]|nr:hypothetical protein [Planctomycetota bacterium]
MRPSTHRLLAVCTAWISLGAIGLESVRAQGIVPPPAPTRLPRHATFVLSPAESWVELTLFTGSSRSKLAGTVQLFLGDPEVPVIAIVGMVGLSVDGADLTALDFQPGLPGIPEPLRMIQDPRVRSIGSWNTLTGEIAFELHLMAAPTTNSSGIPNLPVPMPMQFSGTLANSGLKIDGDNGNIPDGTIRMHIQAFETPMPPSIIDVWFSTTVGFHAIHTVPPTDAPRAISDGDLLSPRGYVVRTNHELTARLGFMPVVPDLGLDAVMTVGRGEIWFSFKKAAGQLWSETLRRWLTHGDLLSERGYVVRTHAQLLARFRTATNAAANVGLDAVARLPNGEILFSTDDSFVSDAMNRLIGHGDLLSNRGRVVLTNAQLLQRFHVIDLTMGPMPRDYGLDAVIPRSNAEVWFSTRTGFLDEVFGNVSDGDLLSSLGYIVARNLDLVAAFIPLEDLANFGLDAATWSVPCIRGDFDGDGDVDEVDLASFEAAISGPALASPAPEIGDLDGDGDSDQADFGIFQRCASGADVFADAACDDPPQ